MPLKMGIIKKKKEITSVSKDVEKSARKQIITSLFS